MPEGQLSSQEVTRAPLDKDHFLKIASEGHDPNNREMLLASLPKEIRNRLDSTHPTYQRNYDIWQAQLDAFLREEHPMLQGGGRENLAREIYQTLRSFGLDLTDKSLPLDKLVKEFLNSRSLQPLEEPPLVLYGTGSIRERLSESQINALLEKQPPQQPSQVKTRIEEEGTSLSASVVEVGTVEEPARVKEPETREVELPWDDLFGMNYRLYFVDSPADNLINPEALNYFYDKAWYPSEGQHEDYLKNHPVQTLQLTLLATYGATERTRNALTAEQVRHHLEENPQDVLKFMRIMIPDAIKHTVKQALGNLSANLIGTELRKNPLLALQTGEEMLDTSKGFSWGRKKPEIQLSSKISKLIIEAMEKLTPEQVRDRLRTNPLDLLKLVPANFWFLKPETLATLREEGGKLRFRMQGEAKTEVEEVAAGPPPPPEKPTTQPEIPVYDQPWQLKYDVETYGKNAQLLGDSYDAKVYQPKDNPGVVVKEYKPRSQAVFEAEKNAFSKLQGSKHIVELLGIGENPVAPYLIKRFFDGENLYETFMEADPFPLRSSETVSPEQRKLAAWFISSMEALAEFYEEGFTVTDFKLNDWLWDPKEDHTVLIDLGNAQTLERLRKEYSRPGAAEKALKTEHLRDINMLLKLFLKSTELGWRKGMNFDEFGMVRKWPDNQDYLSAEQGKQLVQEVVNSDGSNSLAAIILMHAGAMWEQEIAVTAKDYIQPLKDYFQEVGLFEKR